MLNQLRDECHKNAVDHGFWEVVGDDGIVIKDGEEKNTFAKCMALVVSEIGEAIEADRKKNWLKDKDMDLRIGEDRNTLAKFVKKSSVEERNSFTKEVLKGNVEEEIADILIRIMDLSSHYNIDLDSIVRLKMDYNASRPYKHNKEY